MTTDSEPDPFPTLLVTGPDGEVERVLVGADANEAQIRAGLA